MRAQAARAERDTAIRAAADAEVAERKKSATAWVVFAVAIAMLLAAATVAAVWFVTRS